jgi:hypothetical protein
MDIAWRMAKEFQLILREQRIITNLLPIKDMLLLKTIMDIVWKLVKVFQLI